MNFISDALSHIFKQPANLTKYQNSDYIVVLKTETQWRIFHNMTEKQMSAEDPLKNVEVIYVRAEMVSNLLGRTWNDYIKEATENIEELKFPNSLRTRIITKQETVPNKAYFILTSHLHITIL